MVREAGPGKPREHSCSSRSPQIAFPLKIPLVDSCVGAMTDFSGQEGREDCRCKASLPVLRGRWKNKGDRRRACTHRKEKNSRVQREAADRRKPELRGKRESRADDEVTEEEREKRQTRASEST
jgi:hypothetical protein